jgi:hypothetical protein
MENLNSVKVKHRIFEDAVHLTIPPGSSIQQIIDLAEIPEQALPNIVVLNHGSVISDWEYVTKDADNLAICVVPQGGGRGGKSILGAIAMIAIAAFAWWAAPAIVGFGAGSAGWAAAAAAGSSGWVMAASAAITMVGSMAMNALIRPPSLSVKSISDNRPTAGPADAAEANTFVFGGQSNQGRKYQPSARVYGRHRMFPSIAANPLIENAGTDSIITTVYDFGLGNLRIEDLRIGDADASEYAPELAFHYGSLMRSTVYYPKRVSYESLTYVTKQDQPFVIRTKPNSISGQVDLYFPRGLVFYDDTGKRLENKVQLEVWWRKVGNPDWIKVRDDQFKGATVRQDTAIASTSEQYETGVLTDAERYSLYTRPESYWQETIPDEYDYGTGNNEGGGDNNWGNNWNSGDGGRAASDYVETTVVFEGTVVYGGWDGGSDWNSGGGGLKDTAKLGAKIALDGYSKGSLKETQGNTSYYSVIKAQHELSLGTMWLDFVEVRGDTTYYGTRISHNNQLIYNGDQLLSGVYNNYRKGTSKGSVQPSQERREEYYGLIVPTYTSFATSTVVGSTARPFTLVAAVDFYESATHEFQIVRRTPVSEDNRSANDITITLIKSFQSGAVFNLSRVHTMLEMRLLANDKISGVVNNISAICTSVLRVWDGAAWVYQPSRNPAWIVYDVLTGEANPAPLRDDQIDLASFYRLAQLCDEQISTPLIDGTTSVGPRYACDLVVDYETTVYQLIESILSVCRSTLIMSQSGKYGVLIDQAQSVPRQLLTPVNSWNFSGNRTYSDRPNALRVKYVEPELNWQMNEILVYDDGFNVNNARTFEDLATFGITDGARAWRFGRYMLAQGLQRSETFSISVDVENLAVQRGDLVRVAHDVPKIGGLGARVVDVYGNQVKVSEEVTVTLTDYTIRLRDGSIRTGKILDTSDDGLLTLDNTSGIESDDLIVIGNTERVTQDYLVQEIRPGADLSADLTLVRYVEGVYTADEGDIPPWDSGLTDTIVNVTDLKVVNLTGSAKLVYDLRIPYSRVELNFGIEGTAYYQCKVYLVRAGFDNELLGSTKDFTYLELINTIVEYAKLGYRRYYVVPFNTVGLIGTGAYVDVLVEPDRERPPTPYGFSVNVQSELVELFWQLSEAPDIAHYNIRYTPEVISPRWNASQFLSQVSWQTNHTSAGARTGTYMIKAVDTSGNESVEAMKRTTVAQLPNINYIERVEDHLRNWDGLDYLTESRGSVMYASGADNDVQPVSYYVCKEIVDLGEPYEVRISSKIRAFGQHSDDLIYKWKTLADVPAMARATSSEWDAWVEVRVSDAQIFIADWNTMAEIDPIASGNEADWSEWRPVEVGDFTGQYLQFRIQLRSYNNLVRPVVTDGTIEIDMPDRIDYGPDVEVAEGGLTVFFAPAFRVPPSVAISIDGNDQPVSAVVTNKDRDSFDVQLVNVVTNSPVAGRIDWQAKGYGRRAVTSI